MPSSCKTRRHIYLSVWVGVIHLFEDGGESYWYLINIVQRKDVFTSQLQSGILMKSSQVYLIIHSRDDCLKETFLTGIVSSPAEKVCVFCHSQLVDVISNGKAMIFTRFGVVRNVNIWNKHICFSGLKGRRPFCLLNPRLRGGGGFL